MVRLTKPEVEKEVRKEIQLLGHLKHRHIVNWHGSEVENGQAVIAMEFCGGGSLMRYALCAPQNPGMLSHLIPPQHAQAD